MIKFFKKIIYLFVFIIIIMASIWGGMEYYINKDGVLKEDKNLVIVKNSSLTRISKQLYNEGIIDSALLFKLSTIMREKQSFLKAGEYRLPSKISIEKLLKLLTSGNSITHSITIAEGLLTKDILTIIANDKRLTGATPNNIKDGELLPDTYFFLRGEKRKNLIFRMRDALKDFLAKEWKNRQTNLPLKTPYEALILASIIEKETGYKDERKKVASVFINRLNKGIKLQSDPTTMYGIYVETGEKKTVLSYKDLRRKDRYNTYYISALPPTPITNAGKKSIKAALNPAHTDNIFFVANGNGGHNFAKTLKQHNNNVKNFRALSKKK